MRTLVVTGRGDLYERDHCHKLLHWAIDTGRIPVERGDLVNPTIAHDDWCGGLISKGRRHCDCMPVLRWRGVTVTWVDYCNANPPARAPEDC